MQIYRKYEIVDDDYTCKYTIQAYDGFIHINRSDLGQNGEMRPTEHIKFEKDFAYEIAKKVIEEYERINGNDMA